MKDQSLQFLAASELLGGILVILAYGFVAIAQPGFMAAWQNTLGVGFGLLAIYAGVQLLRGTQRGIRASTVVQALQLVSLTYVPLFRFVALAGLKARFIVASNGVHFRFGGGGEFIVIPWAQDGTISSVAASLEVGFRIAAEGLQASGATFAFNFVPVFFLWRLSEARSSSRTQHTTAGRDLPVNSRDHR